MPAMQVGHSKIMTKLETLCIHTYVNQVLAEIWSPEILLLQNESYCFVFLNWNTHYMEEIIKGPVFS